MDIGSAASAFTAQASLAQTAATSARQQDDASAGRGYQRSMGTTVSAATNMLATNFVSTNSESSKYIKATISSLQTENSFGDRMGSLLDGLNAQYSLLASSMQVSSGNGTYVAATLMQHRVEDGVQRTTENEVADESAKNLDDIKQDIEQRAQDATQPQDATSQAGQDATTDGVAATAAAAASVSPAESDGTAETTSPTTGESAAPLAPSSPGMSEDAASPATPTSATELPLSAYAAQQAAQTPITTTTVDMQV
ncbi:MAG: hypothetical protein AAGU21_19815 [Solidesulfovibrio sp.]|uniref:hypothetical protein n=1 Tax=Solidesulfovibrio sp. TaxID=2910990 RepID=UPI002B20CE67|nr:hypothetical protein [Solidesulfovibrio sp.]MEA4858711.1 hypothetical protein [Solidesulfovibrio sp.]